MNKTISVIIPVYNVAAYLPMCMDSVLSQSYRDLEIIVIDDGSTDESGAICDAYAAKDERVRVIHQQNGGAASAKNAGLRVARGYYLAFLDSDDYLEDGAYEFMVKTLETYQADVVQCTYRDVYVNRSKDCTVLKDVAKYEVEEYLKRYTFDWSCGLMTEKLFKRELFADIFFVEGNAIDDEFFTYRGIMNASKIVYVPHVVYNYRKRESSVMRSPKSAERIVRDRLAYLQQRRQHIRERFPSLKALFDRHYLEMLLVLSRDAALTAETAQGIKHSVKMWFAEKDKIAVSLGFYFQLKRLQYSSTKHLLANVNISEEKERILEECFE